MVNYWYIYSPVLNFVETCLRHQDITKDSVISTGVKFYTREQIREAHDELNNIVDAYDENLLKDRRSQIGRDVLFSDMYDTVKTLRNNSEFNVRFTIWKISEIPRIPQDVITSMTVRVNECVEKLVTMIDQCKAALPQPSDWPPLPAPEKPLNRVFISGLAPEKTESCSNQKRFIEEFITPEHVQKIQQTKSGLVAYIKTDSAAQALSDSLSKISDIKVKYQKEKFMAVAKFVPLGTTPEEIIAGNPNVTEAKRYGTSQTV